MTLAAAWSVGEVATMTGVTVRTLHHYDRIGLLTPGARTGAGYRLYDESDLMRLQRILAYRELGLALDDIRRLLDDPREDPVEHLRRQHGFVLARIERLREVAAVLEKTMEAHAMGIRLTPDEMFEVFGDADPTEYAEEAEQRWGNSDAWKESNRRAASYGKDDWLRIREEAREISDRFASTMTAGVPADGTEAMDAAEAARRHIDRWFYPCSPEMHVHLGEMYVADPRFAENYESVKPGLAQYVRDAIVANAARATPESATTG